MEHKMFVHFFKDKKSLLYQTLCIVSSNREKWPVAVRANGHLLLNSEKVQWGFVYEMALEVVKAGACQQEW